MRKIIFIALFSLIAILANTFTLADDEKSPMVYRYWDFGASLVRDQYQFAVLQLVLDKTATSYGPYQLIRVDEKYTTIRATREIGIGNIINIEASPHHASASEQARDKKIRIQIPIMHGLLGYRKLIVRRQDLEKFEHIQKADELKKLFAGQGKYWKDVEIYKYNNYNVTDNAEYSSLFPMLAAKRFDYIPLGAMEVSSMMQEFSKFTEELAVVPNLIIYYPYPVLFNVSANHPELAERVVKGLTIATSDGSLNQLFDKYFHDDVAQLRDEKKTVFILKNPNIPDSMGLKTPTIFNPQDKHESH